MLFAPVLRLLAVGLLVAPWTVVGAPAAAPPPSAPADWSAADRAVAAQLLQPDASLPALATAAAKATPATAAAALERLSLLLRAGLFTAAAQAVAALPPVCPDANAAQLWALRAQLTGATFEAPAVAQALAAAYPNLSPPAAPAAPPPPKELLIMTTDDEGARDYWLGQARHWAGAGAQDRAVAAYQRAVQLTPPAVALEGPFDPRTLVLVEFAHYLAQNRPATVPSLWIGELTQAPTSVSAAHAARLLATQFPAEVKPTTTAFMRWLAAREHWDVPERLVLARLLENAANDRLRLVEIETARGLALAPEASPTRAYELAWVVTRQNDAALAVPLLEAARARAQATPFQARIALALLQAETELGDWRAAEALLPEALPAMTPGEAAGWLGRLALGSARSGPHGQQPALRLWRRAANLNLNYTDGLSELATHGLREPLRAFYAERAGELPDSAAPPRALAVLGGRGAP